jgi:hypothetical protein
MDLVQPIVTGSKEVVLVASNLKMIQKRRALTMMMKMRMRKVLKMKMMKMRVTTISDIL